MNEISIAIQVQAEVVVDLRRDKQALIEKVEKLEKELRAAQQTIEDAADPKPK